MIITSTTLIPSSNLAKNCWSKIKRFHDVGFVTDRICQVHSVPTKHRHNAEKQAIQIRQCLVQAKEYFDASQAVSLATKPVLLYYSVMSLALAEILFKQDGGSSLDKARGKNAHHGLVFKFSQATDGGSGNTLAYQASQLRATPMSVKTVRQGTFELWHRTSREPPICGELTYSSLNLGSSSSPCAPLLFGVDTPFPSLPDAGMTLLDCFLEMPTMHGYMRANALMPFITRGTVSGTKSRDSYQQATRIIIHPDNPEILNNLYRQIFAKPSDIEHLNVLELQSGLILTMDATVDGAPCVLFPHGVNVSKNQVLFSCKETTLNEFGLFYVSLYIAGNYARYYPDKWLPDIDAASPIALAIEELIACAEERIPLLVLSELSQIYHIPD